MQQIPLPRVHVRVCARGGGFRPITSAFSSLLTAWFSVFVRVISISMRVSRGDTSTKVQWNHRRGNHDISAIVHKSHYDWRSDAVCSWKLNDLPGVISLFPQIFFIASFVEMQPYRNLNLIKAVIFHHVVEFELLIRHQSSVISTQSFPFISKAACSFVQPNYLATGKSFASFTGFCLVVTSIFFFFFTQKWHLLKPFHHPAIFLLEFLGIWSELERSSFEPGQPGADGVQD